jgi:hypothetical protein
MKEKIDLPKRSDAIYQKIEGFREDNEKGFKDYEYTNCIAYEMYIRTKNYNVIIQKIDECLENHKENIILLHKQFSNEELVKHEIFIDEIDSILSEIEFDTRFTNEDNPEILNIAIAFSNSMFDYYEEKEEKELINDFLYNDVRNEFVKMIYSKNEEISSRKVLVPHPNKKFEITMHENYFDIDSKKNKLSYMENERQYLSINLNLPKDELIAYLSKIKDEYNKDNSIIKSIFETSEKVSNIIDENLLIHKGTGKYNKNRVADMFFIYDGMKKGMKKAQIINELNYYYYDKDNKNTNFTYDTLTNYYEKAIEFIDNLKYKELITGVKITN